MKIRQLEYFCAVAEEKSISAAARELHVAQPPISRQIAQLEEELGVQLFLRGSKGMVPHRRGTKPVSADAADLSGHPPRGGQRAQRGDGHERAHQARRHLLGDVVRVTLYK